MRLPFYAYTNKNIAGCIAATAAVGAYLGGYIGDFWWAIVPLTYGVVAAVTPSALQVEVQMQQAMTDAQILDGLKQIESEAPKALPATIAPDVVAVCQMLQSAIPIITRNHTSDQISHDVRQMATEYLPQTIAFYTKLPPAFRNIQKLQDGKTATQTLGEQIALLRTHLQSVLDSLSSNDANALLTNGRFLREKFATPDFANV